MKRIFIMTAILFTMLFVSSCQAPSGPTSQKMDKIGEEASNGKVAITVHAVNFYTQFSSYLGPIYKPRQAGEVFVIVELTIKNVSKSAIEVGRRFVLVYDNQNNSLPSFALGTLVLPYEFKKITDEQLPPGSEQRGMAVCTAKEGTILTKVVYTTPEPAIEIGLGDLKVSIPPYRMPRIGEVASGGGIQMKVNSIVPVETLEKEYSQEELKAIKAAVKEGQQLVVIDITLKNVTIKPNIEINSKNVLIVDTESRSYGEVPLTITPKGKLTLINLSPGEEITGRLFYSIPVSIVADRIMYKIGTFGSPLQVSLGK